MMNIKILFVNVSLSTYLTLLTLLHLAVSNLIFYNNSIIYITKTIKQVQTHIKNKNKGYFK